MSFVIVHFTDSWISGIMSPTVTGTSHLYPSSSFSSSLPFTNLGVGRSYMYTWSLAFSTWKPFSLISLFTTSFPLILCLPADLLLLTGSFHALLIGSCSSNLRIRPNHLIDLYCSFGQLLTKLWTTRVSNLLVKDQTSSKMKHPA